LFHQIPGGISLNAARVLCSEIALTTGNRLRARVGRGLHTFGDERFVVVVEQRPFE
jgi:hypothetical protein